MKTERLNPRPILVSPGVVDRIPVDERIPPLCRLLVALALECARNSARILGDGQSVGIWVVRRSGKNVLELLNQSVLNLLVLSPIGT